MTTRTRPMAILALVALIAALLAAVPQTRAEATTATQPARFSQTESGRIGGADAVATAIALSAATYDAAGTAVLARVDDYADALAGAVLAAQLDAPVLFTQTDVLSEGVTEEVARLGATDVVILGGVAAVSQDVEDQLVASAAVRRVAGATRFETALAVADEVVGEETPATVYFVEGENADPSRGWPDAINIAALAAFTGAPILPVNAEAALLPEVIKAQWDEWAADGASGIVIGGVDAVTEETAAALAGEEGDPLGRIAGDTRFATSSAVYSTSVSEASMDPAVRVVIPGGSFAEGIAAGAVAGNLGHPTVMIDSTDVAGSPEAIELLGTNLDTLEAYVLVGGDDVIAPAVADAVAVATTPFAAPEGATCITVLHHNDGESQLLNAPVGEDFGSLARMVTLAAQERAAAEASGCAPITVTSGDNFLAGAALSASDPTAAEGPVLDSIGLSYVGYDALAIGNHDLDFGPEFLARFIDSFVGEDLPPFLSANLDVSEVPSLQALAEAGRIAASTTVDAGGTDVGIIGLTTPFLRSISSPGAVIVDREIVAAVQTEVDALTAAGVDHLVLISHLQSLNADIDFVGEVSGIDAVVAGGGDEVLADPADPLVPGDLANVADSYPLLLQDADGDLVPTVTTAGDYKYLGRLNLYFDAAGEILADTPFDPTTSRMVRLADESLPGGVARDARVVAEVEGPVRDFIADLEADVIATSEVGLDGTRPPIRTEETNLGNLVADAHAFTVASRGAEFGIDTTEPIVGIQNGGGIRNNNIIPAGDITELNTFQILAFTNFIAAVEDFDAASLKSVLETAYASLPAENGAFSQVSGITLEIDVSQTAQVNDVDDEGGVTVVTPGERIRSMILDDGTVLVADGEVVADAPTFTLATIDFSLRNGDGYPFNLEDDGFQILGVTYQQALSQYLQASVEDGGLGGVISAAEYPEGGSGRITITGAG